MMPQPFTRLLWKSYRGQRNIWFMILLMMLLLQFLVLSGVRSQEAASIACVVGFVMATMYMAIATLWVFAMETENRTVDWLRLQRIPWWHHLGAGIVSTVASTGTLIFVAGLVATAGAYFHSSRFDWQLLVKLRQISTDVILPMFFVGLVITLVIRNALLSLLLISGCGVGLFVLTEAASDKAMLFLIPGICLVILPWLVHRWHVGKPWNIPRIPGITAPVRLGRGSDSALTERFAGVLRWRRRTLKLAASGDSMPFRSSRVLIWQELIRAIPFGIVSLGIGNVCIWLQTELQRGSERILFPLTWIWVFCCTLEGGLRTYRFDQKRQNGLFLAHRGVSPMLVWGIKNVVWFGVLATVVASIYHFEQRAIELTGQEFVRRGPTLASELAYFADLLAFTAPSLSSVEGTATTPFHVAAALLCTGFLVAQLCSVWIRSPLVAFASGLGAFIWLTYRINFIGRQDVPLIICIWPIAIFCLIAIVSTRRQWMDRRGGFDLWVKRGLAVGVLFVVLSRAFDDHRVTQIPALVGPLPEVTSTLPSSYSLGEPTVMEGPYVGLWKTVGELPTRPPEHSDQFQLTRNVVDQSCTEALKLVEHEDHVMAFRTLIDGLRLGRHLALQTYHWKGLAESCSALSELHQHLQWCATSDQISSQQLQDASWSVLDAPDQNEVVASMLMNRVNRFRRIRAEEERLRTLDQDGNVVFPNDVVAYLNLSETERIRHDQFLVAEWNHWVRRPGMLDVNREFAQLIRLSLTTSRVGRDGDPLLDEARYFDLERTVLFAFLANRATWWILQAQSCRRDMGRLPNKAELMQYVGERLAETGRAWPQALQRPTLSSQRQRQIHFYLDGCGDPVEIVNEIVYRSSPKQPVIGFQDNLGRRQQMYGKRELRTLPFDPNRILYVEPGRLQGSTPPVSGERAKLISAKMTAADE